MQKTKTMKSMSLLDKPVSEVMTRNVVTVDPTATILSSMRTMVRLDIRRLPVVERGRLAGIFTMVDALNAIYRWVYQRRRDVDIYSSPVKNHMTRNVIVASPDTPIIDVVRRFVELGIGSMPVVDEDGKLVGIFTEWDAVKLVAELDLPYKTEDAMTHIVYILTQGSTMLDALEGIVVYRFRRYPVLGPGGKLIGTLHAKDVLRYLSDEDVVSRIRSGLAEQVLREPITMAMTSELTVATLGEPIRAIAARMVEKDVGGLPVVDQEGNVVGVVTEKTLLNLLLDAVQ